MEVFPLLHSLITTLRKVATSSTGKVNDTALLTATTSNPTKENNKFKFIKLHWSWSRYLNNIKLFNGELITYLWNIKVALLLTFVKEIRFHRFNCVWVWWFFQCKKIISNRRANTKFVLSGLLRKQTSNGLIYITPTGWNT